MQGQAVRESVLSDFMSSCSTLATPTPDVNLGAGGPRAASRRRRRACRRRHALARRVEARVLRACSLWFESCDRVIAWSSGRVVE